MKSDYVHCWNIGLESIDYNLPQKHVLHASANLLCCRLPPHSPLLLRFRQSGSSQTSYAQLSS